MRVEIDEKAECEEVILRCPRMTPELEDLRAIAEGKGALQAHSVLPLTLGDETYFVPLSEVLFFLSDGSRMTAHTEKALYYTDKQLYELEEILPSRFFRVSKSCILNISEVRSMRKELSGICEVKVGRGRFSVFVSRMYAKPFKERLFAFHDIEK